VKRSALIENIAPT